jgi:hypothetical protein
MTMPLHIALPARSQCCTVPVIAKWWYGAWCPLLSRGVWR